MKAAVLHENAEIYVENQPRRYPELPLKTEPLTIEEVEIPIPTHRQILIRVEACGVCYTDIDIVEGRVKCKLPLIPGHQVIGIVEETQYEGFKPGDRVGVAWIANTCGICHYCTRGMENLCVDYKATGCHVDGGYAEYMVVNADYAYRIPFNIDPVKSAPLMCAGAVGYRAFKLTNPVDARRLGLFGFGASAHIVIQIARILYPDLEVYVFTRSTEHRDMAMKLGADWAGHPSENPPGKIDRAIDFTPVGETIKRALELLNPGGRLVVNVIRKQTPIDLIYEKHLWEEKEVKSTANVTRRDVLELLEVVSRKPIEIHVEEYSISRVNEALRNLKAARVKGSAVLKMT